MNQDTKMTDLQMSNPEEINKAKMLQSDESEMSKGERSAKFDEPKTDSSPQMYQLLRRATMNETLPENEICAKLRKCLNYEETRNEQ